MLDTARLIQTLQFWRGYEKELVTLALYAVGIAVYALLVSLFYRSLSKRDLFGTGAGRSRKWWRVLLRGVRYLTAFPLISFLFFVVLASALFFLSKSQTASQILLISMSVVASVRATAYLSETASEDLAKLVPLGLLGVFLVDPGYLDLHTTAARFREMYGLRHLLLRYLIALVLLEVTLKLVEVSVNAIRDRKSRRVPVQGKEAPAETKPLP
jgi:hypothetical protein